MPDGRPSAPRAAPAAARSPSRCGQLTQSLRSAIVTVGGQTHTVTQDAANDPCTYDLDPAMRAFSATAASSTVHVNTQTGCAWTAVSSDPWIVVSPTNIMGSGSADISYSLTANTTSTSRSGTITIAGRQHAITQQGETAPPPPPCTYVLSPAEATISTSGGIGTVKVTTGPTCPWTAVSNAGFITVLTESGTGTFDIQDEVRSGPPTTNRMGTITVMGQEHTVRQRFPDLFVIFRIFVAFVSRE